MTDVDPSAPTLLNPSPRARCGGSESAEPEDTVDRLMGKLLRDLPMGGVSLEPPMGLVDGALLDREVEETADNAVLHVAEALREARDGGRPSGVGRSDSFTKNREFVLLNRYLVLETLGQGGMGIVFKAYDQVLRRVVAVKVLHETVTERSGERLVREAQALAQLSHPNVVQVFDFGVSGRRAFVAMEFIEGQTLREWQNSTPKPAWTDCVKVYTSVAQGLEAAHKRGLIHRDFKPDNCIVDDDEKQPRVIDFGLVGATTQAERPQGPKFRSPPSIFEPRLEWGANHDDEHDSSDVDMGWTATKSNVIMGTPAYMPPEQLVTGTEDARSDQFSFCVAFYEALYGELPFEGGTFEEYAEAVRRGQVRAIPRGSEVPFQIRHVLLRGLAPEPGDRWPSMDRLIAELTTPAYPMPMSGPWYLLFMLSLAGGLNQCGA